jgi:hypothetical protein
MKLGVEGFSNPDNGGSLAQPRCRFSKTELRSISDKNTTLGQNSELKQVIPYVTEARRNYSVIKHKKI